MFKRYLKISFVVVLGLVCGVTQANAFALSPATIDLQADRGEVLNRTFTLINEQSRDKTFYFETIKFAPRESGQAPQFIPPSEDKSGLAEWVGFPESSLRVPAHSQAEVQFNLAVPADVKSGGYYAAILVSDAPSDVVARNGALIEAKTAILLFLTVAGETEEKAALLDFTSEAEGSLRSGIDIPFAYRVQNQGNVHITPTGMITLTDIFGRTVMQAEANPREGRVLPNSTRTYSGVIEVAGGQGFFDVAKIQLQNLVIGPVTAQLNISYGAQQHERQEEFRFWVIPWQLITIVVGLVAIGLFLYRFVSGLSRRESSV